MKLHVLVLAIALLVPVGAIHAMSNDQQTYESMRATSVQGVQQHTIFLEMIVESEREGDNIEPFAAIVGLVKKCNRVKDQSQFDNAVLWFNDQFLFGQKSSGGDTNETPETAIGENPPDADLYPNCWIPNGFAHVVPSGELEEAEHAIEREDAGDGTTFRGVAVSGTTFQHRGSYYVTDPNGASWVVDKFTYEMSRHCHEPGNGTEDETAETCQTESDSFLQTSGVYGTLYTVHLQVDSQTQQGFRDVATWSYPDGELRSGLPHNESVEDDPATAENERQTEPSIEYDFLVAVDLGGGGSVVHNDTEGGESREGNSHPHRGKDNQTRNNDGTCSDGSDGVGDEQQGCAPSTPRHEHDTQDFDVFYNKSAPNFVEENRYWTEDGTPPSVSEDCQTGTSGDAERDEAIEARANNGGWIVCDPQVDTPYHKHDGSETILG
jgi:hypothetical protein